MKHSTPVTIGLVDPETLVRTGIAKIINEWENCQVTLEAAHGKELQEKMATNPPLSLLIMEVKMPELDGFRTLLWLKNNHPHLPVIILTSCSYEITKLRLISSGARSLLGKCMVESQLKLAIQDVLEKGFYYADATARALLSSFYQTPGRKAHELKHNLSEAEWDVWQLSTTALTNKEIAKQLCKSVGCVNKIINRLFDKLDVRNRTELSQVAKDHGLLLNSAA